jgi:PTH1 family peptidyl-tRNA hydrolase
MKLVVGLGNPEEKYKNTRHNIGFRFIDEWNKKHSLAVVGLVFVDKPISLPITSCRIHNEELLLFKPNTGMNNSGKPIKEVMDLFELRPEDLIVVFDDMDFDLGAIKVKKTGEAAGHNGIKSIIQEIGKDFIRVRLGIDKAFGDKKLAHVLGDFSEAEQKKVEEILAKAVESVINIIEIGVEKTMNKCNQ